MIVKRIFCVILTLIVLASSTSLASSSDAKVDNSLYIQTLSCPADIMDYAEQNAANFVEAMSEGSVLNYNNIRLGQPFTYGDDAPTLFTFPVLAEEEVIYTFRVAYSPDGKIHGTMSTFLVSELNAYVGLTTTDTPLLFDVRENTLYACIGDESEEIFKFPNNNPVVESTSTYKSTTFETKNVLDGIDINYSWNTTRASGCEIELDRSEQQGRNNNWCVAYVTAAIIRTLTNQNTMAEDIMEWYYGEDVSQSVYLTNAEAALYAREVARLTATTHSTGTLSTSRLMEELNYGRPVYLAMVNVNDSSNAHAVALRGYNSSHTLWSIWDPSHPDKDYETFPIGGNLASYSGNVFSYDETIYNFYANWRSP